ncbi:MAG: hypothetical protein ACQEXX_16330 [Bacillota bacterium]
MVISTLGLRFAKPIEAATVGSRMYFMEMLRSFASFVCISQLD